MNLSKLQFDLKQITGTGFNNGDDGVRKAKQQSVRLFEVHSIFKGGLAEYHQHNNKGKYCFLY